MVAVVMGVVVVGVVVVAYGFEIRSLEVVFWFCFFRFFNDVVSILFFKIVIGFWFSFCILICDIMILSEVRFFYIFVWIVVIIRWFFVIFYYFRFFFDLLLLNLIVFKESLLKRVIWKFRMFFYIFVFCVCSWLCVFLDFLFIWWKFILFLEFSSNYIFVNFF